MSPKWEQASTAVSCGPDSGASMGKQLRTSRHKALMAALVAARERAGVSQRELARRLERAHSFVGKIESGERQLNVLEFIDVAAALNVGPGVLFVRGGGGKE